MSFQDVYSGEIITSSIKKPDDPDYFLTNPLKTDIYLNGIELILDPEFSLKGNILILIDGNKVYSSVGTKQLKGYSKFPIPLQRLMKRDEKIEIFAWNKKDTNQISLNLNLSLSKTPNPFNSQAVPLSPTILNQYVSDDLVLFPNEVRTDSDETKLIFMEGYKKLLINMSAQTTENIVVFSDFSTPENIVDADLNSKSSGASLGTEISPNILETRVDFGTKELRNLSAKFESHANSNRNASLYAITRVKVFISDDDIIYNEVFTQDIKYFGNAIAIVTSDAGLQDYRYAIVSLEDFDDGAGDHRFGNTAAMYEIFDNDLVGGSASLSFQILNIESNQWLTLIPSSEFGTVTQGQDISEQIGDVITKSISGKTYALPSTQTSFRARLIVTGAITISVTAQRVL